MGQGGGSGRWLSEHVQCVFESPVARFRRRPLARRHEPLWAVSAAFLPSLRGKIVPRFRQRRAENLHDSPHEQEHPGARVRIAYSIHSVMLRVVVTGERCAIQDSGKLHVAREIP